MTRILPDRAELIRGVTYALASAALFGSLTTFAKLSYLHGGNPIAVVALRFWFAASALMVLFALTRRPWRPDPRERWSLLGVGMGWFVATVGYVSSVNYIPVSLAALVFYTFPLMVGALAPWTGSARVSPLYVAGFLVAFCGLILAFAPGTGGLDWRGVALAMLGAAGAASTFLFGGRAAGYHEPLIVSLYTSVICALLVSVVVTAGVSPVWPLGMVGRAALGTATVIFVLAVSAQFFSLRHVQPDAAAVMFNIEPFVTIAMAWALLGEHFSPAQWFGAALVVVGITLVTRNAARREPSRAPSRPS